MYTFLLGPLTLVVKALARRTWYVCTSSYLLVTHSWPPSWHAATTSWGQQALHSLMLHLNIGIHQSAILHDSNLAQHGAVTKRLGAS